MMKHQLDQVRKLLDLHNNPPLVVAGDVFHDGWRTKGCSAELINFAISHLPKCYAVPGQHDLPHHRYDEIHKSAYWTLIEAGVIKDLKPGIPYVFPYPNKSLVLHGFPWQQKVQKLNRIHDGLYLAVIHSYVWMGSYGYEGAPKSKRVKKYLKLLKGFDAAVFGDNHKGFLYPSQLGRPEVFNCGQFIPANSDQREYKPMVGRLYADGRIIPYFLDTVKDEWNDVAEQDQFGLKEMGLDPEAVVQAINDLGEVACEFAVVVRKFSEKNDVRKPVVNWLTTILEAIAKK